MDDFSGDGPREPTDFEISTLEVDLAISRVWPELERLPELSGNEAELDVVRNLLRFTYTVGRRDAARDISQAIKDDAAERS